MQATVREGHERDYEIVVIEDCCGTRSEEEHQNAVAGLQRFCTIVTSAALRFA